jgi:2'-5' RNA ligase
MSSRELTYPIERAQEITKGTELEAAVTKAADAGQDAVQFMLTDNGDGTYDITAAEPDGVMVAWMLPDYVAEQVAIPGGQPADDLHVTIAYLGDAAALSLEDQRKLIGVVGEVCLTQTELDGQVGGTGRFTNGEETDPFWVGVNIPGLTELRNALVTALSDAGIQPQGFSAGDTYQPHITVDYIPAGADTPPLDFQPVDVTMKKLTVCVGPHRFTLDLQKDQDADDMIAPLPAQGWTPSPIAKQGLTKGVQADAKARYTLAPFYIPDRLDAHGEYTDAEEIEKAFWGYMGNPDSDIRLQHNTKIIAGKRVDGVVWPFEVTLPLTKADGTVTEHTFPAGTPFLGVKWEPWAYQLVEKGLLNGYSMGGTSQRIVADMPGPRAAK